MRHTNFDRIIIGSGFAGLSAAYHLGKLGEKILVFEQGTGREGASFASTAEMNHDPDVDWNHVIKKYGVSGAKELWNVTERAIKLLTKFAHQPLSEHFETKRVPAFLFSTKESDSKYLLKKLHVYKKLGADVDLVSDPSSLHPSFKSALRLLGDGRTNNQALLRVLASKAKKQGTIIKKRTQIREVVFKGKTATVITAQGDVYSAKRVHIATGKVTVQGVLPLPIESRRTFVLKYRKIGMPELFRNSIMWDVAEPFHYIRTFSGNDLWIGGEDMPESKVTNAREARAYTRLDTFSKKVLGLDSTFKRHGQWSGTFFPTEHSLPYIADHKSLPLSYSVGFGGSGLLMSFMSGYLHAQWKQKKDLNLKRLFALDK